MGTVARKWAAIGIACFMAMSAEIMFAGCGGSSRDTSIADGSVTLKVSNPVIVDNNVDAGEVKLTVSRVEDTRCGFNEECVAPGYARIYAALTGGGTETQELAFYYTVAQNIPASGARPGYRIEVTNVKPDKKTIRETIPQEKYRISFRVTRLSTPVL